VRLLARAPRTNAGMLPAVTDVPPAPRERDATGTAAYGEG